MWIFSKQVCLPLFSWKQDKKLPSCSLRVFNSFLKRPVLSFVFLFPRSPSRSAHFEHHPIRVENGFSGPWPQRCRRKGTEPSGLWGRVTCVHTVGLSSTPAVVKSVTVGPFSVHASHDALTDEERPKKNPLKRFCSRFPLSVTVWELVHNEEDIFYSFFSFNFPPKRLKHASGNATS